MEDFRNLSTFSGYRIPYYIMMILIIVSTNSYAISNADNSASGQDASHDGDVSDKDQSPSAAGETESSDEDSDNDSNNLPDASQSTSNSTSSNQPNQDSTSDEEQTSTASEQEGQQDSNATSSVSDPEDTNQTSSATTNDAEQGQSATSYNQTGNSNSNSTAAAGESIEGYQSINDTSTVSNSTYTDQQDSNSTTGSNSNTNTTNPDSGSGFTPLTANSTNYNRTQTGADTTLENNSNANMTNTVDNNSTTSAAENQNSTVLAAPRLAPDFTISVDPLTMSVNAGSSATYSIMVTSENGFNSNVSLTVTSPAISGITTSLGSNVTRPPVNASTTTLLTIQSDAMMHSGKYKLKITGSAANITGTRAASVTLEVIGQNVTASSANDTLGLDDVALTPILIKDIEDNDIFNYYGGMPAEKMVFISTTVVNNYNRTQPFILVMEIRDKAHQTLSIQLLRGVLNPDGQLEFDISWMPGKAGTYEIRSFVIDHLPDPSPLSAVIGKTYAVS